MMIQYIVAPVLRTTEKLDDMLPKFVFGREGRDELGYPFLPAGWQGDALLRFVKLTFFDAVFRFAPVDNGHFSVVKDDVGWYQIPVRKDHLVARRSQNLLEFGIILARDWSGGTEGLDYTEIELVTRVVRAIRHFTLPVVGVSKDGVLARPLTHRADVRSSTPPLDVPPKLRNHRVSLP
ncbi:hypothetical protein VTO42DRAFT_4874 [Malbranchea cinnamomea]